MNPRERRAFRPGFDSLNERCLLSGGTLGMTSGLSNGILTVLGSDGPDTIWVGWNGDRVTVGGSLTASYPASAVRTIVVDGRGGNDNIGVSKKIRLPTFLFGGDGDDTLRGGGGNNTIYGGSGNNTIYGGLGTDTIDGGPGHNTIIPGSGRSSVSHISPAARVANTSIETQILNLTNAERARAGLAPLKINSRLNEAAAEQSQNMTDRSSAVGCSAALSHELLGVTLPTPESRLACSGYYGSTWGENIAYAYRTVNGQPQTVGASQLMSMWMNSPPHRADILNPEFTEIGISVRLSRGGQTFATQEFGRPA